MFAETKSNTIVVLISKDLIKKKKKKHDKIVLFAETIVVLIYKDLIDSNISHDEFVSINNVLNECDNMKEEIKNSNDK